MLPVPQADRFERRELAELEKHASFPLQTL